MPEPDRQLDFTLGRLLGLDVLGWAQVFRCNEDATIRAESAPGESRAEPVYLPRWAGACRCAAEPLKSRSVFGHTADCLSVVPEYSRSLDAMAAVEEELDRRGLADAYVRSLGGGRACPGEVTVAELWRRLVTAGAEARAGRRWRC